MDISATAHEFARGALAGLVVCVPPGPMSALCVTRSVRHGFVEGFAVAAGSALGDAAYVALAAFGVASFRGSVGVAPRVAACAAAPLLLWMGVRALRRARTPAVADPTAAPPDEAAGPPKPLRAAATGFAMALGTPGTLPALVALFAALGTEPGTGLAPAATTTAGALAAALVWWSGVALLSCRFRDVVARHLRAIDAAGGALLVLAACVALHVALTGT